MQSILFKLLEIGALALFIGVLHSKMAHGYKEEYEKRMKYKRNK